MNTSMNSIIKLNIDVCSKQKINKKIVC